MPKKANMHLLLDQVSGLMETLNNKSTNPDSPLPKHVQERLNDLERTVSEFVDLSEKLFSKFGYEKGDLEELAQNLDKFDANDQQLFKRALQLKEQATGTYHNLSLAMQMVKKMGNMRSEDPAKRIQERQKRFNRVGGRKGWTPM